MAQVMMVAAVATDWRDRVVPQDDTDERAFRDDMKRIGKAAYSILAVIESHGGIARAEIAGEHYVPERCDPHGMVSAFLAEPVGDAS